MVDDDVYLGGIMEFTKMQGIGNDYVYVNCFEEHVRKRLCLREWF